MIENEINFEDIYTTKNRVQYKIKIEDNILKTNNISFVESRKKIIIIIAIKYKLEVITFELNDEKYDANIGDLKRYQVSFQDIRRPFVVRHSVLVLLYLI